MILQPETTALRIRRPAWPSIAVTHLAPLAFALMIFLSGCARGGEELTILSYNVQNLFDDIEDGHEYADFRASAGYTPERYFERLAQLADTLRATSNKMPDIIILQEIEGPRVVADLLRDHLRTPRYAATVIPNPGQMGVVILSRVPPSSVRTHQSVVATVYPRDGTFSGTAFQVHRRSRLITEVDIDTPVGSITLLGCHWKSQSGGESATEPLRLQESALVVTRLGDTDHPTSIVLVVGDLNEDVEEYRQHRGSYQTALMPVGAAPNGRRSIFVTANPVQAITDGPVVLFSPWLGGDPGSPGSYAYRGSWERLDQVLCGPLPRDLVCTIRVVGPAYLLDTDGHPARYNPRTGAGHSDHLPVLITIRSTPQAP